MSVFWIAEYPYRFFFQRIMRFDAVQVPTTFSKFWKESSFGGPGLTLVPLLKIRPWLWYHKKKRYVIGT